jgi:Tol biopolymer transport system component
VLSPDGLAFAFVDYDTGNPNASRAGGTGYYGLLPDRKLIQFCEDCSSLSEISSSVNKIVFRPKGHGSLGMQVFDPSTGQAYSIFPVGTQIEKWSVKFSPDQRWVLFMAGTDVTQSEVYAAPFSDNRLGPPESSVHIVHSSYKATGAYWSADGDVVYFVSRVNGFACLWAQRVASDTKLPIGEPVAVRHFHNPAQVFSVDVLDIAFGRGQAGFPLQERRGKIWILRRNMARGTEDPRSTEAEICP